MSSATLKPIDQRFPWTRYWQVQDSARGADSEEDHGESSFLYVHRLSLPIMAGSSAMMMGHRVWKMLLPIA